MELIPRTRVRPSLPTSTLPCRWRRRYAGVFQQNVKRIRFVLDIALAHQLVKHTREEVHLALRVFFSKKKNTFF